MRIHHRSNAQLFQDVYNTLDTYTLFCQKAEVYRWKKALIEEKYFETRLNPGYKNLRFEFHYNEEILALEISMKPCNRKNKL